VVAGAVHLQATAKRQCNVAKAIAENARWVLYCETSPDIDRSLCIANVYIFAMFRGDTLAVCDSSAGAVEIPKNSRKYVPHVAVRLMPEAHN